MFFLLRTAFWLMLILAIIPVDRQAAGISDSPSAMETLSAVQAFAADIRGFCDRNPQSCATGAESVDVIKQKAIYSVSLVNAWLDDGTAPPVETEQAPRVPSGLPSQQDPIANLLAQQTATVRYEPL